MKTRKIVLLIIFLIGVISLWLMSSFTSKNACDYAVSNIEYIQEQVELALTAEDFEKSKYLAYKALNSIEKTQSNFLDCGCGRTIACLKDTSVMLKNATRASSFEESKKFLQQAMENTQTGLKVLNVFDHDSATIQSSDILQMNVGEVFEKENEFLMPHKQGIPMGTIHKCLLGFESSLEKVVTDVDCREAHKFIYNIHQEASENLLNTELSEAKKQYHQRVRVLTKDALTELDDCKNAK